MEIQYPEFSLFFILFSLYVLVTFDQLIYYWVFFRRLAFYKPPRKGRIVDGVSIIVCAKNEYYNLEKNLPILINQDHPNFEVIVVNDASDDDSLELLKAMEREYENFKLVNIPQNLNFFKGKKFPLSIGIKSAKYEVLLLTDADCTPSSDQWVKKMTAGMKGEKQIVLGYGPYKKTSGLLNYLIRFDTLHVAVQYLSYSLSRLTYMGVGRNLAYHRSLFYEAKGFMSHYNVSSGDDDLFINRIATKTNTRIEIDPSTYCYSDAKQSFQVWFSQKRRHLSTGKLYKQKYKSLLGKYAITQLLFYSLLIPLIITNFNFIIVISLLAVKIFSQLFIFKRCMNALSEKGLLLAIPFLEIALLLIQIGLSFSNLLTKQSKWK